MNPLVYSKFNAAERINATAIAGGTLVGYVPTSYPFQGGNCFCLAVEGDKPRLQVMNFGLENLEVALTDGYITFPIKVLPVGDRHCLIADERIPDDWYLKDPCGSCTPEALRPMSSLLKERLAEIRGERKVKQMTGKPGTGTLVRMDLSKKPPEWKRVLNSSRLLPVELRNFTVIGAEQVTVCLDEYKLACVVSESLKRNGHKSGGHNAAFQVARDILNQLRT